MLKITIPTPCHESWDNMAPAGNGRHCAACAKTVIDFTAMTDEAISNFFVTWQRERVCGRFKNNQLSRVTVLLPQDILHVTMPRWKQFLTACLLSFSSMLFSCDASIENKTMGEPLVQIGNTPILTAYDIKDTSITNSCSTLMGDTILIEPATMGVVLPEIIEEPTQPLDSANKVIEENYITGKIAFDSSLITPIIPDDSVKIKNPPKADSTDCNNLKYY
jgi:hypothetical protein